MKKRNIVIAALITAVFGGLILGGGVWADDVDYCNVSGSSKTRDTFCAGSLYRKYTEVKKYCKTSVDSSKCQTEIKKHLQCPGLPTSGCESTSKSYANNISSLIYGNNPSPCPSDDSGLDCRKEAANWKWYYQTKEDAEADNGEDGESTGDDDEDESDPEYDGSEIATPDSGECTSILPGDWCNKGGDGIEDIIRFIIAILTGAIVVAGTIGIIICGVMWMTARENENQVATAKKRMLDIVIGMVAWILLSLLANLFIPKSSSDIDSDISQTIVKEG